MTSERTPEDLEAMARGALQSLNLEFWTVEQLLEEHSHLKLLATEERVRALQRDTEDDPDREPIRSPRGLFLKLLRGDKHGARAPKTSRPEAMGGVPCIPFTSIEDHWKADLELAQGDRPLAARILIERMLITMIASRGDKREADHDELCALCTNATLRPRTAAEAKQLALGIAPGEWVISDEKFRSHVRAVGLDELAAWYGEIVAEKGD